MAQSTFEISADTKAIADRLRAVPVGATISYQELSTAIGRDIRKCRHILYSAFNVLRRDDGAVFGSVHGEGYKRLRVEDTPAVGVRARKRVRRTARRAARDITASLASANHVPNDVRLKANAELSMLGLLEHLARDSSVRPTDDMQTAPQPVAVVAKAFLDRIGAQR